MESEQRKKVRVRVCPLGKGKCVYWRPTFEGMKFGSCYCHYYLETGIRRIQTDPCGSRTERL
jgi:hypothetical protein